MSDALERLAQVMADLMPGLIKLAELNVELAGASDEHSRAMQVIALRGITSGNEMADAVSRASQNAKYLRRLAVQHQKISELSKNLADYLQPIAEEARRDMEKNP